MNNTARTTCIGRSTPRRGFTLVELMVVISLIILLASIAIPSIIGMFSAGADKQAYNSISSLLTSARAHAMKTTNYVAVHFQMADPNGDPSRRDTYYAAVLEYEPTLNHSSDAGWNDAAYGSGGFVAANGFAPVALRSNIAMGQLTSTFISLPTDTPPNAYKGLDDAGLKDFMTFTILFSPKGLIVPTVMGGRPIYFKTTSTPNASASYFDTASAIVRLWALTPGANDDYTPAAVQGKTGVSALTVFDLTKVEPLDPTKRATYMTDNAPFLPINCYTGQLFPR